MLGWLGWLLCRERTDGERAAGLLWGWAAGVIENLLLGWLAGRYANACIKREYSWEDKNLPL